MSLPSPKSAAESAFVYRRRRAERPRERWLRILGLVGALLVHLVFLFGAILGPAYEMEELTEPNTPLQVRLIEKKQEEPPPPPPVRGTPPRQVGPVHRGNASKAPRTARQSTPSIRANSDIAPVPVPAMETPVIARAPRPTAPRPEITAAPLPPVTVSRPAPTEQLAPVPTAPEPPQVALETPTVPKPTPPKFQPEPVRKPQVEGNEPVPPPASLAMPEVPAPSAPVVAPPTIAMEKAAPVNTPPSLAQVARPEQPAAPPEPEMQAVPLPAQAAPTVNLQPQPNQVTAVVPREQPRIEAPAIRVAEPELEAVPLPPNPQPSIERPQAPKLETAAPRAIALDNKPSVERPQISLEPPAEAAPAAASAAAAAPSNAQAPSAAGAQENAANSQANTSAGERGASSAPNASPQGSSTAAPGQPNGVAASPAVEGQNGLNLALPPGQGNGKGSPGPGEPGGPTGSYVQLKPHGNTEIMSHGGPNIGYQATRFEKDWTPEGESSIDTALRHAVEKTTMRHTFHLPRGVRVECVVMPLFPVALFGCGDGDPPPKPVDDVVYERMKLAPTNPLVPPAPSTAQGAPTMATIKLDNSAQCAAARVAGGPMPPGCEADPATVRPGPAHAGSTWVPASDQFH
ncbi:hypothetical protein ACXU4B_13250 [Dyella soli]